MSRGRRPDWDFDRAYGEQAEQYVAEAFDWLCDRDSRLHVEVKQKRYNDDSFYVETSQLPRGASDYVPSGICTTRAELYAVSIADTGIVMIFPTALLRSAINANLGRPKEERDGSNPTRGRLLRLAMILAHADHVWRELRKT